MSTLLTSLALLLGTGVLALATSRWPRVALGSAALGAVAAAILGVPVAVAVLRGAAATEGTLAWRLPAGAVTLGIDPLSAFFLLPVLVLGAVSAVFGAAYLRGEASSRSLGAAALFFNATLAAMVVVLLARDGVALLVAWEVMTLASYLMVSFEHEQPEVRRAGWVYLVAGHAGVACLLGLFLTLGRGGFGFAVLAAHMPAGGRLAVFVLGLAGVGFGIKAGVVPLHVWLPEAHAAAPSHVSALMSGALIKLGLYGLLRVASFLPPARWWGPTLIVLGLGGGLVGISLSVYQRDLKRALAYSSIENVGIILIGLGLGYWGLVRGDGRIAALGLGGALFHLWSHAATKGLLFLVSGSVMHGAGSKDLERLGGLLRRMPWTGTLMVVGAVGIAGLPPLSGFAGEWLIYLGLLGGALRSGAASGLLLLFVTAGLATMGALAVLAFVRLVGIVCLGQPRSPGAAQAHESGAWLLGPMLLLAAAVPVLALAAPALLPLVARPVAQIAGGAVDIAPAAAALRPIVRAGLALFAALLAVAGLFAVAVRRRRALARGSRLVYGETWGCGYLAPTSRMQYTGRSFAEVMSERVLPPVLRARVSVPRVTGLHPGPAGLSADSVDPLTRAAYEPLFDRWARRLSRLRWLQQGLLHLYLVYIVVAVLAGLAWISARRLWGGGA
jgi:hydrogenase-4 component B